MIVLKTNSNLIRSGIAGLFIHVMLAFTSIVAAPNAQELDPLEPEFSNIANGVWKVRIGEPDIFRPSNFRVAPIQHETLDTMPAEQRLPFNLEDFEIKQTARGLLIYLPMIEGEDWYGGGLTLSHFRQTGRRQVLKVTSDPLVADGSSHAPVPFYVSTGGYGFLIDSAREIEICFGGHNRLELDFAASQEAAALGISIDDLYDTRDNPVSEISIMIPRSSGADIYLFAGPTMRDAIQRHILFSGGGTDVPEWGLGVWYRGFTRADAEGIRKLADHLQEDNIPCSVFGLEPGWQERAYSNTLTWSRTRFPDPAGTIADLSDRGYKINLWQHAFIHPDSPLYEPLLDKSGDHKVWRGLVPDLAIPEAHAIFTEHQASLIEMGVSGFKLDECDNSDTKSSPWSWPDHAQFPSGADGEQMHAVYGLLYMRSLQEAMNGQPTFGQVRQASAFCSPLPYVLYSDLYEHESFLRGVGSASISGLLWTPEVRHGGDGDGLVQRMAAMVLAPQFLINAWYCPIPPWHQPDKDKNQAGIMLPDNERIQLTDRVRTIAELRMKFVPYLKKAFVNYAATGIPAFRAPVVDHPEIEAFRDVDDAWLVGDDLYFAPIPAGQSEREILLPPGVWVDYFSGEKISGNQTILRIASNDLPPIFKRFGANVD